MSTVRRGRLSARPARRRGMAMALTMLVLMGVMAIILVGAIGGTTGNSTASGAMTASENAVQGAWRRGASVDAFNLAEAGSDSAWLWMTNQSTPPANTAAFAPSLWGATVSGSAPPRATVAYGAGSYSVTIYPFASNPGNPQKSYLIESIGTVGPATEILHVCVQQSSFSKYAFFLNNSTGSYWQSDVKQFDGPVHINGGVTTGINWRDNTAPIFQYTGSDAFTVSNTINWEHNGSGGPTSPPLTTTDWATVSQGGSASVKQGVPGISLPTQTYIQQYAALGLAIPNGNPNSLPPPTVPAADTAQVGATINPGGGIYVHGDVQQMTLSVDPVNSANQVIELYQPSFPQNVYTKIEINAATSQTTVLTGTYNASGAVTLNSTQPTITNGTTNGVVYTDGNIGGQGLLSGGLKGVIADNAYSGTTLTHSNGLTIVTDPSKNVNIDGTITDNTPRQIAQDAQGYEFKDHTLTVQHFASPNPSSIGDNNPMMPVYVPESQDTGGFAKYAGRLGIVSKTVEVLENHYDSTGTTALSNFDQVEVDAAVLASNTYELHNGFVNTHTFLNMGNYIIGNGAQVSSIVRLYDNRLADIPPPFFPTTGTNYTLISWQRVGATLE